MSTLVFDIEGDNLLDKISKIHCVVTEDVETEEINAYYGSDNEIYKGLLALYNADCIIGHNIINFDIPAIRKFYPRWTYKKCYDTFILSSLFEPDRPFHSIESYGNGMKVENEDWSCLTYNMLDRCVIDVIINTHNIWLPFKERAESEVWMKAIELEQEVAANHVKQVQAGVHVDKETLISTLECLDAELEALTYLITKDMPYRLIQGGQYKKVFKKDGDLQAYVKKYFGSATSCLLDS